MLLNNKSKISNILYLYIILVTLPLFLGNFSVFHFITQGTTIYSFYIYSLFFLLPLYILINNNGKINVSGYKLTKLYFIMLFYFIFYNLNMFDGIDVESFIKTIIISIGFITFLLIVNSEQINIQEHKSFMKKILLFIILISLYNLVKNYDMIIYGVSDTHIKKQFASFFSNKNTFAMVLGVGIISSTYLLVTERKLRYLFILLFLFINLFLTNSTNGFLSSLIFLMLFFLLLFYKNIIRVYIFGLSSLVTLIILYIRGYFDGIIDFFVYRDFTEFSGRTDIWKVGIRSFLDNPIIGIGIGKTEDTLSANGFGESQFHNSYLEILVAGGSLLMTIYIILTIIYIVNLKKLYKFNRLLGSLYIAAFFSFLFNIFFESYSFFSNGFYSGIITIFYLLIPMLLIKGYKKANEQF